MCFPLVLFSPDIPLCIQLSSRFPQPHCSRLLTIFSSVFNAPLNIKNVCQFPSFLTCLPTNFQQVIQLAYLSQFSPSTVSILPALLSHTERSPHQNPPALPQIASFSSASLQHGVPLEPPPHLQLVAAYSRRNAQPLVFSPVQSS